MAVMQAPNYLAYVFWHWLRAGGDVAAYEDALAAFQHTLQANAPPGYRGAAVFRHDAAPWLSGGNGAGFGNADGADTTTYLTSGKDGLANPGAMVAMTFDSDQQYFGLLWGSVDAYNTLRTASGVSMILGGLVGVTGLALIGTAPTARGEGASLKPMLGPAGLGLRGAF